MDKDSYAVKSYIEESKTPEEIRNDIDATRAALDRTVTEIEHRLQPRYLYEEAKSAATDRVRRASGAARDAARTAAERAVAFGYRTADRVKQSPGATIGTAAGVLAALLLSVRVARRLRRGRAGRRRPISGLSRPEVGRTQAAGLVQPVTRRRPWRRSTAVGLAAATLGACGSYAARSRR